MFLLSAVYAIVSFTKLGTASFPITTWQPTALDQSFILELSEDTSFDAVYVLYGEGFPEKQDHYQIGVQGLRIEGSDDKAQWELIVLPENNGIYEYGIYPGTFQYRYIRITASSTACTLSEIGFKKTGENSFLSVTVNEDAYDDSTYPAMLVIDEQEKLVIDLTSFDQAYFDEIYHARNAWEIANGQYMYGTVHPLFGTNLMALSIKLFGLSPFSWRLPGALCGVFMIPLLYALLKNLVYDTFCSMLGTALLSFDFMHMTTSRIGTLEPFSIFFILCMFFFMVKYAQDSFFTSSFQKQMKYLFFSGVFMGIAIAVKWTACYSAVGLAVILFTNLYGRYREYMQCRKIRQKIEHGCLYETEVEETVDRVVSSFPKYFWKTILYCIVFFIIIPVVIYWVSYLPDPVWKDGWSAANVWNKNLSMYDYHKNLQASHPYQSSWWEWILDLRPMWYYLSTSLDGTFHTIACFSNPLLTWIGIPAVTFTVFYSIFEKDMSGWIITVGYLSALLPWVSFVERCVFSYHFYPTSIFTILAIAYLACQTKKRFPITKNLWIAVLTAYIVLFVMFMPVTCGFGTSRIYVQMLEFLPGWYWG